jgi:ACR3 family arsenite efflux pump ArsB
LRVLVYLVVVFIVIPLTVGALLILLQVYFNSALAYGLMHWLQVEHSVAAPGALIGASNFFEIAVATAISVRTRFGGGPGYGGVLGLLWVTEVHHAVGGG